MSEMIERVALAISGGDDPANVLAIHRSRARAAIEAMREPTKEMMAAGSRTMPDYDPGDDDAKQCWHEMIDEALK